jgi:nucleoside-diphosphate-sugar epimerase
VKRLLITGARGFVGRHCLQPAIDAGFDVHATCSPNSDIPESLMKLDVRWHRIDLLQSGAIENLISAVKPSHALHTAWETSHGSYWSSPANLEWLELGSRFLRVFAECGGSRFVSVGTCAEYDWSFGFMTENVTPEIPATFYGRIKLIHREMLAAYETQFGLSTATGRIFFAYGPYEDPKRVIPHACQTLLNGDLAKFTSASFYRDFMHVSDVGRGFIALLQSELRGVCNVSSGISSRLSDLIMQLGHIAAAPELIRIGAVPDRANEPPMLVGDNRLLKSTGWSPQIAIDDGLKQTYDWWRSKL